MDTNLAHAERDELILEVARILGVTYQPEGHAEQPADGATILAALRDQRAHSAALANALRELLGQQMETDARSQLATRGDALASVVLADAAMPETTRELAERLGVSELMRQVWLNAYQAGWRAGAARVWPARIDGIPLTPPWDLRSI